MQWRHKDLHDGERDRSIDYTPGKVRDPRSGWQAMCTDPGRSSKQYHAAVCASMHTSGARANRLRNAQIFVLTQMVASPIRVERVSNYRDVLTAFTFLSIRRSRVGKGTRSQNSHFDKSTSITHFVTNRYFKEFISVIAKSRQSTRTGSRDRNETRRFHDTARTCRVKKLIKKSD